MSFRYTHGLPTSSAVLPKKTKICVRDVGCLVRFLNSLSLFHCKMDNPRGAFVSFLPHVHGLSATSAGPTATQPMAANLPLTLPACLPSAAHVLSHSLRRLVRLVVFIAHLALFASHFCLLADALLVDTGPLSSPLSGSAPRPVPSPLHHCTFSTGT
jgi:hypothetical protein